MRDLSSESDQPGIYIYLDDKGDPLVERSESGAYAPMPPQSFNPSTDVKSGINNVDFGIEGGTGRLLPVSGVPDLSLNVRGLYGLTYIQKYSQDGSGNTGNLLVDIGYSYTLPVI